MHLLILDLQLDIVFKTLYAVCGCEVKYLDEVKDRRAGVSVYRIMRISLLQRSIPQKTSIMPKTLLIVA